MTLLPILTQATLDDIVHAANASDLMFYVWKGRGRAPRGYIKGMAACYGLAYAKLRVGGNSSIKAMVEVVHGCHDVFDWYSRQLRAAGMVTSGASDVDRLRYLYVVMTGLGMRESSGGIDIGQDPGAPENRTAERAEAGIFQQSWDSREANLEEILKVFDYYCYNPQGYRYSNIFREGAMPRYGSNQNYGEGDGCKFQELCKTCPEFAVEAAAIALRRSCTAWGPIVSRSVEIRTEADELFQQVQQIVDKQFDKDLGEEVVTV